MSTPLAAAWCGPLRESVDLDAGTGPVVKCASHDVAAGDVFEAEYISGMVYCDLVAHRELHFGEFVRILVKTAE